MRYQEETADFREGEPPTAVLWGEATDRFPTPEGREAAAGQASGQPDRDNRKLLTDLESSVENWSKVKVADTKGKPHRNQFIRKPTATHRARWVAAQQAAQKRVSLQTLAREPGTGRNTVGKYRKADGPHTKLLSAKERAKERAKAWALVLAEPQTAAD